MSIFAVGVRRTLHNSRSNRCSNLLRSPSKAINGYQSIRFHFSNNSPLRAVVGLSGGVDSSVVALLLKLQGFEVVGCFMNNWDRSDEMGAGSKNEPCPIEEDYLSALSVAEYLNIPLHRANFVKEYWENVFQRMLDQYQGGLTPNPDAWCNRYVKLGAFRRYALEELNADVIALGHYAQIWPPVQSPILPLPREHLDGGGIASDRTSAFSHGMGLRHPLLISGVDNVKDQSDFLALVKGESLQRLILPLGKFSKRQVREIARYYSLPTSNRKDSVGFCFIGKRPLTSFLADYIPLTSSSFVDITTGSVLAPAPSAESLTIGQRAKIAGQKNPYYIACLDVDKKVAYSEPILKKIKAKGTFSYSKQAMGKLTNSNNAGLTGNSENEMLTTPTWVVPHLHHPHLYTDTAVVSLEDFNWLLPGAVKESMAKPEDSSPVDIMDSQLDRTCRTSVSQPPAPLSTCIWLAEQRKAPWNTTLGKMKPTSTNAQAVSATQYAQDSESPVPRSALQDIQSSGRPASTAFIASLAEWLDTYPEVLAANWMSHHQSDTVEPYLGNWKAKRDTDTVVNSGISTDSSSRSGKTEESYEVGARNWRRRNIYTPLIKLDDHLHPTKGPSIASANSWKSQDNEKNSFLFPSMPIFYRDRHRVDEMRSGELIIVWESEFRSACELLVKKRYPHSDGNFSPEEVQDRDSIRSESGSSNVDEIVTRDGPKLGGLGRVNTRQYVPKWKKGLLTARSDSIKKPLSVVIEPVSVNEESDRLVLVLRFDEPHRAITPGQVLVLYSATQGSSGVQELIPELHSTRTLWTGHDGEFEAAEDIVTDVDKFGLEKFYHSIAASKDHENLATKCKDGNVIEFSKVSFPSASDPNPYPENWRGGGRIVLGGGSIAYAGPTWWERGFNDIRMPFCLSQKR